MARRPDVFVRSLSMDEGRKLQRITRTAKDPVKLRRAIVVLMSGQGQAVGDITGLLQLISAERSLVLADHDCVELPRTTLYRGQ